MNVINTITAADITTVILAGGEGRRMGGIDKGLIELDGKPLIEHVIARLTPQTSNIVISANRNIEHYQAYGYPVITDQIKKQGPLGGILSALLQCKSDWLLTVPCDSPQLPLGLIQHIINTANQTEARLFTAHDGHRSQPLFSIIHRDLTDSLQAYLSAKNQKAALWLAQQGAVNVDFSNQSNAFINLNTTVALAALQKIR